MRSLRLLPILLLLTPSLVSAQTTNSRTQDGLGNRIDSATSTPAGTERGIVVRPIPGAAQPVTMTTAPLPPGAATLTATQDIEAAIREAQGIGGTSPFLVKGTGAVLGQSIAVRCETADGLAFESCAGASSGGSTGVAQGSTTAGQVGVLGQGAVTTAPPSYTTGLTSPMSLTLGGSLRSEITDIKVGAVSVLRPTVGSEGVNVWNLRAFDATNDHVSIQGESASGATNAGRPVKVGGVFTTTQPTFTTNQTGDIQMTPRGALIVAPGVEPFVVSQVPATSGGGATCYLTSAASTNATNCKASAGQVYHISAINTTATLYYLRMYNLASAPTCSSATGFIETLPVPASTTGSGFQRSMVSGQAYSTGVGFCLTGGGSSTDNTSAATGVYLSVIYK